MSLQELCSSLTANNELAPIYLSICKLARYMANSFCDRSHRSSSCLSSHIHGTRIKFTGRIHGGTAPHGGLRSPYCLWGDLERGLGGRGSNRRPVKPLMRTNALASAPFSNPATDHRLRCWEDNDGNIVVELGRMAVLSGLEGWNTKHS